MTFLNSSDINKESLQQWMQNTLFWVIIFKAVGKGSLLDLLNFSIWRSFVACLISTVQGLKLPHDG